VSSLPSRILEEAVQEFSRLPGIGKRSALRLVLHLLKAPASDSRRLGTVLSRLRDEIRYCRICNNISESDTCVICSNPRRETSLLCVVEDIRDVIAIENTGQYQGRYHVLGGIISPIDGIGPQDLSIEPFLERIRSGEIREVIMALGTTLEGDTTTFYIYKRMQAIGTPDVKCTTIARGISVGDELEYADEVTLGRSILQRVPYEQAVARPNER
jgi:recombination protein RecR